jgi:hypothetical protein
MVRAVCQSALLALLLLLVLLARLPQVVLPQLLPACLCLHQARRGGASSGQACPACP